MPDRYIEEYGRRLFGLCMALCRSRPDAENLYQETWLRALDRFDRYDPSRAFEPWITRICVNLYRNMLRRSRRSPFFDAFPTAEAKERTLGSVSAPEARDYSDLYAAVNALPEPLRMTVILYYFRDMDVPSVASALSIPQGTVKSRLSHARKRLKEVLLDEDIL